MNREVELRQASEHATTEPRFQLPQTIPETDPATRRFELGDELRVKSAEYWLKLGVADEALRELEALPEDTWKSSRVLKIRIAALGMLSESGEVCGMVIGK